MGRKILLVEDDDETGAYLAKGLARGLHRRQATTGRDGLFLATDGSFDAIVLDRMLPGLDGSPCSRRCAPRVQTPVLILSALAAVDDRIAGSSAAPTTTSSSPSPSPSCSPG